MPVEPTPPWDTGDPSESIDHDCRQLRDIRRTQRAATITVDEHLRLERFDQGAADAFDLSHEHLGRSLGSLGEHLGFEADDVEWCLNYVLSEGTSLESEIELGQGRRFEVMVQPFVPVPGHGAGALLTLTDITQATRLHEHLKRVADSVEGLLTPFIILDEEWRILTWNRGAELVYGYARAEMVGESYLKLVPDESRKEQEALLEEWLSGERAPPTTAKRVRKDGEIFPVRHELTLVEDTSRTLLAISDRDISERIEAERRRDFLVKELDHRVKNLLTIVLGVLERTASSSDSIASFVPTFRDRVKALAVAHRTLASGHWEGASLSELVSRVTMPLGRQDRIHASGDDVILPAPVVSPLAMALHELATNALRHGALSLEGGSVTVEWKLEGESNVRVVWSERGGPPVEPPKELGFGTRLIQHAIPYEIGGTTSLAFRPEGVHCEIEAPLKPPGGST